MGNNYEIFKNLIDKKGVTVYKVAKETGMTPQSLYRWKNGESIPKANKLQLIADYLDVSLEYLLGKENENDSKMSILVDKILDDKELVACLGKYFSSSTETRKKVINMVNLICEE